MPVLWIAGLGPGGQETLTLETLRAVDQAEKVILRTKVHPAAAEISARRGDVVFCDGFYESGGSFKQVYEAIADFVYAETRNCGSVCYCVPGHPLVAEETTRLLLAKAAETACAAESAAGTAGTASMTGVTNIASAAGTASMTGVTSTAGAAGTAGAAQTSAAKAEVIEVAAPVEIRLLPAVSFLDAAFVALGIEPIREKLSILDSAALWEGDRRVLDSLPKGACLFAQAYDQLIAGELKLALLEEAPPDAEVIILYHAGVNGEEKLIHCSLAELDHFKGFDHLTSVYLPYHDKGGGVNRLPGTAASAAAAAQAVSAEPAEGRTEAQTAAYPLDKLVEVFRRLLGPGGCPWDQKQTHETLKPYLLEEANEALEAIDEKDMAHLKEELGDVLMQIVFHCALAEGRGDFDVNDVIDGITEKMIRRHPHVFGSEKADNPEEVMILWQKVKAEEEKWRKNAKKP